MIYKKINSWVLDFKLRKKFYHSGRTSFFELAGNYLPKESNKIIVDIGSGRGEFAETLELYKKFSEVYLLDANEDTVKKIHSKYKAVLYKAPDTLPFPDSSVAYIHCSHLVEHLYPKELYKFLYEIDRVLDKDGMLIISTPLFWKRFYDDLSHIRPYNPQVFLNYLCGANRDATAASISSSYELIKIIYRYKKLPLDEGIGSRFLTLDIFIRIFKVLTSYLGFASYIRNGFTIILHKQIESNEK